METRYVYTRDQVNACAGELLEFLKDNGAIRVQFKKKPRTIPQNDTFHMWCEKFAQGLTALGRPATKPEVKLWMKHKFLGLCDVTYGDKVIRDQLRETSDLDSGEFYIFMERMWEYAATDFGIFLPIPEDSEYKKIKAQQEA